MSADDVRLVDASDLELLVSLAREIESETDHAFGCLSGDQNRRDFAALDVPGFAGVGVFGVLANDDVIDFARLPNLFQFAVNLVLDARVQLHRPHVGIKIKLLAVGDYLSEAREL